MEPLKQESRLWKRTNNFSSHHIHWWVCGTCICTKVMLAGNFLLGPSLAILDAWTDSEPVTTWIDTSLLSEVALPGGRQFGLTGVFVSEDFFSGLNRQLWMIAFLRTAPAIRRILHPPAQRHFSSSLAVLVRNVNPVKTPRWLNSKRPQDTPAQEEADSNEPAEKSESNSDSPSSGDESSSQSSPPSNPPPPSTPGSIAKQSVPETYSQVLALPIARRPLFPGFYKPVVIQNPTIIAAIKEMLKPS